MVTGGGTVIGQGILKSLRRCSLPLRVVAVDPYPDAVGLYRAHRGYTIPLATAPGYLDSLRGIIKKECVDVLLVGTDVELPVLAAAREQLESETGVRLVVSSPEVVAIADDKWLTVEFLRVSGFHFAQSALPADITRFLSEVPFPLLVKPRHGARSCNVRIVRDSGELDRALREIPAPIIQECLLPEEEEYTCGAIVFDTSCWGVIVMRRQLRDGNTYIAEVNSFPHIEEYVSRIASQLGPYGPVNVQLRLTRKGPTVFEINARFSGTTALRSQVGWNEVEAVLRYVLQDQETQLAPVRRGHILRYWNELFVEKRDLERLHQRGTLKGPCGEIEGFF
jgi:carbamoyl-phosphate synthase large subunit